ncbi:MAG: NeuB family protein [Betaproteobacteria bacterium]|nr:NeuB family protein [Betaproteobacteria bacterium]
MSHEPNPLLIIAEAAQGYEGDAGLARALVRAAAGAGADAVKLQLVYADELCAPGYKHHGLFRSLEMPDEAWFRLSDYANERKIALMLDVFGSRSLALAARIGAAAVKIHSTDMSNIGLLREVDSSPVQVVMLSTGGCSRAEIEEALACVAAKRVVLLHGFQGYPTPLEANQLGRFDTLRAIAANAPLKRGMRLGFADHVPSGDPLRFTLAAAALGMGARVLEKHITLAHAMKLEDHESALGPDEFAHFVSQMRQCMEALPAGVEDAQDFGMHESERAYRANTRKHVVALRPLKAGSVLAPEMVGLKRTASERFICDPREVYGRRLTRDIAAGHAIIPEMLSGEQR